jgi:lipoate-protein ligase A
MAFSLGYFQDPNVEFNVERLKTEGVDFVRRITGGGIILHNNELTYSLTCSDKDLDLGLLDVQESFKRICSFLLNAYARLGLKAKFSMSQAKSPRNNWFCFAHKEKYDIVIDGKKIGGTAQKRKRGVIFQHGSIPLRSDIEKALPFLKTIPEDISSASSVEELLYREVSYLELKKALKDSFEATFNIILADGDLTYREKELAGKLRREKYITDKWNLSRHAGIDKEAAVA